MKHWEQEARRIVAMEREKKPYIIAAYSDGSFARGDMVPGSDVDIGFVVPDGKGEEAIQRTIIDGTVFEWGFFDQHHYEDTGSILEQAGLTHDVVIARLWFDHEKFLTKIQSILRGEYQKPETIRARAMNQVKEARSSFEALQETMYDRDVPSNLSFLITIVRKLFAVPTAIRNRAVTNCRAPLYCSRDSEELGHPAYTDHVLDILGSHGFSETAIRRLLTEARSTSGESGLPGDQALTYSAHLDIVSYFLDRHEPAFAMWPLFFWTVGLLGRGKITDPRIHQHLLEGFQPILHALKVQSAPEIAARFDQIRSALGEAEGMVLQHCHETTDS
jgi:hypothetical protein